MSTLRVREGWQGHLDPPVTGEELARLAEATDEELGGYARACRDYCDRVRPEDLVGNLAGHQALHELVVWPSLREGLRFGDRVLDFACGIGRVTALALKAVDSDLGKAGHAVGVDVSRPALARAAQIVPGATFLEIPGMKDIRLLQLKLLKHGANDAGMVRVISSPLASRAAAIRRT